MDDFDHHAKLMEVAKELNILRKSGLITDLNIAKSISDFDESARNKSNPLSQDIPLESRNIFVDVIHFAMKHNKELLYTIIQH